jgi:hypothetical protein
MEHSAKQFASLCDQARRELAALGKSEPCANEYVSKRDCAGCALGHFMMRFKPEILAKYLVEWDFEGDACPATELEMPLIQIESAEYGFDDGFTGSPKSMQVDDRVLDNEWYLEFYALGISWRKDVDLINKIRNLGNKS